MFGAALSIGRIRAHYRGVIMSIVASQITSISTVCSAVCSGAYQGKHQSPALLACVRVPLTKDQQRGKCFHFMTSSCCRKWVVLCRGTLPHAGGENDYLSMLKNDRVPWRFYTLLANGAEWVYEISANNVNLTDSEILRGLISIILS